MPPPNRRHEPSPEELARQVADQLARSKPSTARFSLRNSVLVGRFITGVAALVSIGLMIAGVVAGVGWLLARTTEPQPEVLANTFEQKDAGGEAGADDTTTTTADGTLLPLVPLMFPTPLSDGSGAADQPGPTAVTIPPVTTTTTTPAPAASNPVVSTTVPTTTSVPGTGGSTSSTTATTTQPTPTTTFPVTTTTMPATTTMVPPTTTTTTIEVTTTTTTRPSPPSTPGRGG